MARNDDTLGANEPSGNGGKNREDEGRNRRENVPPKTRMQYNERIVKTILNRGDFQTWRQAIEWMDTEGRQDDALTPREAAAISADFKRLQQEGAKFTRNPEQLLQVIRQFRG